MNNTITYTNDGSLEKQIRQKKIIPYMVFPNEKFKTNKWYYSFFYNSIFKVLDHKYNKDGSLDYAYTMSDDGNYALISTDIDSLEDYSVSRDRRSIYKLDIVNHVESFTGAEIIYWFFMNDIDALNIKYQGFWKYVDRYSIDRVSDRDRYYVRAKLIGNKYMDCQIIKDTSKQEKERIIMSKIFDKEATKYMANLKKKDVKRMQERHDIKEFDNKDSSET